jgi:ATP-dependent Clp protease ATP-binding subunit ClpB
VIVFHPLEREQLTHIVEIQLQRLQKLLATKRLTLELTTEAKFFLAERGFDPVFGARPLKRVMQRELQDALANELLGGRIRENDHIVVDVQGYGEAAQLVFTTVMAAVK